MAIHRAIPAGLASNQIIPLQEVDAPGRLPLPYALLYHLLPLSEDATTADLRPVSEGDLLVSAFLGPDASIDAGPRMDAFLRSIPAGDRLSMREALEDLERAREAVIDRGDVADSLWHITPTPTGRGVMRRWRDLRLDYLEHRVQELGAVPRGWRQWRAELFNPSWVVPAFWGLVGALLAFVITHFI